MRTRSWFGDFRAPTPTTKVVAGNVNHFAWLRTRLAVERTFMAWLRTAASMIGFGFTIVEFFSRFAELAGVKPAHAPHAPRVLGLMLIGAGVVSLAVAFRQYVRVAGHLDGEEFAGIGLRQATAKPVMLLAVALLVIGVFAFLAIVLRLD